MSEHSIITMIGEDVEIEVFFDYTPAQKQTNWDPHYPSEVDVNAILLMVNETVDFLGILSEEIFEGIRLQCFEDRESNDDR